SISKGLCRGIARITKKRLEFENNARERAAARTISPFRQAKMPIEGRVTYMKLKGDQLLHLAEMARQECGVSTLECEGLAAEALESYLAAKHEASGQADIMIKTANSNTTTNDGSQKNVGGGSNHSRGSGTALPELHPLQLELAFRISAVLLHLLDRPVEAWEAAYPTYLAAAEQPARLGARGLAITQALRDHLASIEVRPADGGHQDEITATHGQGVGGMPASKQAEEVTECEWGFLRVSAGLNGAFGDVAQLGPTASDRLRVLAQVKRARVCMEGVTPNARVLLGTMKHADVCAYFRQVFAVYAEKHADLLQLPSDDAQGNPGKHVRLHGQKTTPRAHLRRHVVLSWRGFEAICHDFDIAPGAIPKASPAPRHLDPLTNRRHQDHRGSTKNNQGNNIAQDPQRSPRTTPGAPAAATTPRNASAPQVFCSQTYGGGLISRLQARIAFVSARTHGSVIASFPSDGRGSGSGGGGNGGDNCLKVSDDAGSAGRNEMIPGTKDAAYWREMERALLTGSTQEGDTTLGLNFGQFVDALARCGLIGFARGTGDEGVVATGVGGLATGQGVGRFVSPAERTQAIFVETMRLLDREHVDANLHRQCQ
ncbi:unnamed protein product, partial [Scytosiphon promiscuus]